MSSTWEPEFSLPDHAILEGLAEHGFEERNHGREEGLDLEDYLQDATNVINAPDVVVSFEQNGSVNTAYGSADLGRAVWVNGDEPTRSTSFNPSGPDGVAGYFERTLSRNPDSSPEILLNDILVNEESNELVAPGPYSPTAQEGISPFEIQAVEDDAMEATEGGLL